MERMGFEARRMGGLVEDLLTLIRADAERMHEHERVDLSQLLVGVVDDAAVIDPTRTWRLAGASAPAYVMGDRLRLHQLFANLLSNVRTHTPPGTTATVSVLSGHDEIAVTVTDDGPGVTPEALPRLFDRFFREDESRSRENGGSGLGLSIVAAIVRSHGGRILAAHAPGGGLTMTVVLPRPVGTGAVSGRGTDPVVGVTTGPIDLSGAMADAGAASGPTVAAGTPGVAAPVADAGDPARSGAVGR
jgi:two-component system OmpR family sensor kinase